MNKLSTNKLHKFAILLTVLLLSIFLIACNQTDDDKGDSGNTQDKLGMPTVALDSGAADLDDIEVGDTIAFKVNITHSTATEFEIRWSVDATIQNDANDSEEFEYVADTAGTFELKVSVKAIEGDQFSDPAATTKTLTVTDPNRPIVGQPDTDMDGRMYRDIQSAAKVWSPIDVMEQGTIAAPSTVYGTFNYINKQLNGADTVELQIEAIALQNDEVADLTFALGNQAGTTATVIGLYLTRSADELYYYTKETGGTAKVTSATIVDAGNKVSGNSINSVSFSFDADSLDVVLKIDGTSILEFVANDKYGNNIETKNIKYAWLVGKTGGPTVANPNAQFNIVTDENVKLNVTKLRLSKAI